MDEIIEMPQSRYTALQVIINQLRTARKNLMILSLSEQLEDEYTERLTALMKEFRDISDRTKVVESRRGRPAENSIDDPRTEDEKLDDAKALSS